MNSGGNSIATSGSSWGFGSGKGLNSSSTSSRFSLILLVKSSRKSTSIIPSVIVSCCEGSVERSTSRISSKSMKGDKSEVSSLAMDSKSSIAEFSGSCEASCKRGSSMVSSGTSSCEKSSGRTVVSSILRGGFFTHTPYLSKSVSLLVESIMPFPSKSNAILSPLVNMKSRFYYR